MNSIICSDCGRERKTRYSTAKYCLLCRYARNLVFLKESTVPCILGEHRFAPLKRGEEVCGHCNLIHADFEPKATCAFCKEKDQYVICEDIHVCWGCATDPKNRKLFRQSVLRKQKQVIEECA